MTSSGPMPATRTSIGSFLATARASLKSAISNNKKATFVVGNESADLDSLTSALVLAYFPTFAPPKNAFSTPYIPLVNIPSADLALRPEYAALVQHAGFELEDLITLDDIPSAKELKPENTAWLLVDHNALLGKLGEVYGKRVIGCIDHHDEEPNAPKDTGGEPRVIEKAGSCSSLVTEYCKEAWDRLSADSAASKDDLKLWDSQVAKLALASILEDTSNLQSKDKTTEHDTRAVDYLETKVADYDRTAFYNEIDGAKRSIDKLKLYDILRKDYKEWTADGRTVGISSVVKPLEFLLQKAGQEAKDSIKETEAFLETLRRYTQERKLSVFSIMTTSNSENGEFRRQLLVWGLDDEGVQNAQGFEQKFADSLQLTTWADGSLDEDSGKLPAGWRRAWWQGDTSSSRKQVAPKLREVMESKL